MKTISPLFKNKFVSASLKSGNVVTGLCVEINPVELKLLTSEKIVTINREDVEALTGKDKDNVIRNPVQKELYLHRCFDPIRRCEGVKFLDYNSKKSFISILCKAKCDTCEVFSTSFNSLNENSKLKLLSGLQLGKFPESEKELKDE